MHVKLSEVVKSYKSLRENGLNKEAAIKALEKNYSKKGYTGSFILKEDGEEIGTADLEFKEIDGEEGGEDEVKVDEKGISGAHLKALADSITKGFEKTAKSFVPATPKDKAEEDRAGFKHAGEFLMAVKGLAHGTSNAKLNAWREKAAPSVSMGESTGEAGGVLVPPSFMAEILKYQDLAGANLSAMAKDIPVGGNAIGIPTSEDTPWGGGVQAYWQSELDVMNQKRPSFKDLELRLNDLTVLCPVGNNLMDDSPAAAAVVTEFIGTALNWKKNEAIVNGSGVGMPQGILNSGALVEVAKESGQAAGTFVRANLTKMFARALPGYNYAWFVTPQGKEQLLEMTAPGGQLPAFFNGQQEGISKAAFTSVYGRPMIELENCSALGQKGDIFLADMNSYITITKTVQMATSIHLFFDANATAFRAVARMDGKTQFRKPVVSAKDATFKRSHFITLAARA